MKNFQELRDYLKTIPNLNEGGCLISAYSMYLYLRKTKQLPNDFKIYHIARPELQRFMLDKSFNSDTPEKYAVGCDHALIYTNGMVFDSEEERLLDIDIIASVNSIKIDPSGKERHILAHINVAGWNKKFDRSTYVPQIANELGIDLSNIKLKFTPEDYRIAQKIINDENDRITIAVAEYEEKYNKYGDMGIGSLTDKSLDRALAQLFS